MKPAERVLLEIKHYGGEKKLSTLLPTERVVWEQQALFLSFLRETEGDVESACSQSGAPHDVAARWYEDNELDFIERRDSVFAQVGHKIANHVTKGILSGEVKSPGIIKLMLEGYLPSIFGDQIRRKTPEGQEILEKMRQMNAMYAQQIARQSSEANPDEEVDEAAVVQEATDLIANLQKRGA